MFTTRYLVLLWLLFPSVALAQFPKDTPERVKRALLEGVNPLAVVHNPKVQQELDIIPEQRQKIDRMFKEHRAAGVLNNEAASLIQDNDEHTKYITESETANVARSMETLCEILLPHQLKRLDQLVLRLKVEQFGLPILRDEPEVTHLGFPGETLERLQEATEKAHEEKQLAMQAAYQAYVEAVKKAELDCQEKIMGVLTPVQRQALDELLGPPLKTEQ